MSDTSRYVGPTPERLRRAGRNVEPVASETGFETIRMLDGSPLERLATVGKARPRKGITGPQYHAGCRYYADAYQAGMMASGVVDTAKERVDGGRGAEISSQRLEAMGRYNRALRSLDSLSAHVLSDVVLSEMPLAVYADRFRKFPQPRERRAIALQRLRDALDQLDEHYNGKRVARMETMHEPDYRPVVGKGA